MPPPPLGGFLAQASREYFKAIWKDVASKVLMVDEVKVEDTQWISVAARLFVGGRFSIALHLLTVLKAKS